MINTDLHKSSMLSENNFVEILKHELKTPILAQIRILELLLSGYFGKLKFEQSEILKTTLNSCEYVYKIISDIICKHNSENILFAQKIESVKNQSDYCLFLIKEFAEKKII